jgi:hypothetical protein
MQFIHSLALLGVASAPLAFLTAATFLRGPTVAADAWTAPPLAEFEKVKAAVDGERARLADSRATAVDPAGFSVEGKPDGELALPYELAGVLAAAERARHADDLEAARAARSGLDRMVADRLSGVQKLRPNGPELASDLKRRLDLASRRCKWLENRQAVAHELKSAEEAIAVGPEGDGDMKCLLVIKGLRKQLPATAESLADEPADALTPDEAARAAALVARATFRRDFFKAREAAGIEAASSADLERLLAEWATFLATYGNSGPPDDRDKPLLEQARALERRSQLALLRAVAREQSTAGAMAERVAAWLKEAGRNPAELDAERKAARALLQRWIESRLPALAPLPPAVAGVQEGFTETKRMIGFFEKVKGSPAQYRWWPWDTAANQKQQQNKGVKQINLKSAPATPQHDAYVTAYEDGRKEFLAGGFTSRAGVQRFQAECERLATEFEAYRQLWDGSDYPRDKSAQGWGEIFASGRSVATGLHEGGDKNSLWELLSP